MSRNKCCVPGCQVIRDNGIPLHRFPDPKTNPDRYKTWVSSIGNPPILLQDKNYVYNNLRVCRKHFKSVYLYPPQQLCKLAIPELLLSGDLTNETKSIAVAVTASKDDHKDVQNEHKSGGIAMHQSIKRETQGGHITQGTIGQSGSGAIQTAAQSLSNQPGKPSGANALAEDPEVKKRLRGAARRIYVLTRQTETSQQGGPVLATTAGTYSRHHTGSNSKKPARESSGELIANTGKKPNLKNSFREALTGCTVAVIPKNFPATQITDNDVGRIVSSLWHMMADQQDPLPRFSIGTVIVGSLHIFCEDTKSADWLQCLNGKTIGSLKLKVVSAKDLPKPVKMAWKSKNVWITDTPSVLAMLQRLNPELSTGDWKIVDTLIEETYIRRIVLMDRASSDYIKAKGYCLYAGVDKAVFQLLEDSEMKAED